MTRQRAGACGRAAAAPVGRAARSLRRHRPCDVPLLLAPLRARQRPGWQACRQRVARPGNRAPGRPPSALRPLRRRWLLTGTPLVNHASDYFPLFAFLRHQYAARLARVRVRCCPDALCCARRRPERAPSTCACCACAEGVAPLGASWDTPCSRALVAPVRTRLAACSAACAAWATYDPAACRMARSGRPPPAWGSTRAQSGGRGSAPPAACAPAQRAKESARAPAGCRRAAAGYY